MNRWPDILRCPGCRGALRDGAGGALACDSCGASHPVHDGIPWLFRNGASARAQWSAKLQHHVASVEQEIRQLASASQGSSWLPGTAQRLERLRAGKRAQLSRVVELLAPFGLDEAAPESGLPEDRIPSVQHLGSYLDTAFRDWCWGEAEVRDAVAWLAAQLEAGEGDRAGRHAVVLGGGAGRLTCELAALGPWASVVQLDVNPLLSRIAALACRGESVELTELPAIPLGLEHVAVEQSLRGVVEAPEPAPRFCLGDVFAPPFAEASIDVIVTPWFIDVLPEGFRALSRRINRLLKPGGTWISFGPLSFESLPEAARYTPEEVLEALVEAGMGVESHEIRRVPYLHSPHAMARRHEEILGFRATRRTEAADPGPFRYYPAWMTDSTRPIPALPIWTQQQRQKVFDVQILGLIDGRRSIDDVVSRLATEFELPPDRCRAVVDRFFSSIIEESRGG
ncbi:MAG: PqqD family peptide modification chaperone [Myxococcota bacterium]